MRVRAFDQDNGTWFQSHVLACINSGWYRKYILIAPCGNMKAFDGLERGNCNALVQRVMTDIPTEWALLPYTHDVNKQVTGFEDFPERLYCYHGYAWLLEDKHLLLRLLQGKAIPTDKSFNDKLPGWHYVYTQQDADDFLANTCDLHDTVLGSLSYTGAWQVKDGRLGEHGGECVTMLFEGSPWCKSVELAFDGVTALNLRPPPDGYDGIILDSSLFVQDAQVFFADDRIEKPDTNCNGTWITAHSLRWRFVPDFPLIRQEQPADYPAVHALVEAAFATAAHGDGTEADYLRALREKDTFIPALSLVADLYGKIVGQVTLTRTNITTPKGEITQLALSPLSVHPDYFRQGIARALVNHALGMARQLGYKAVFLCGEPEVYTRLGFAPSHSFGIHHVDDPLADWCMARELTRDALVGITGTIDIE